MSDQSKIYIDYFPGELRAAVLDAEGKLVDYALHRPGKPDGWGDVYLGRLYKRLPTLGGAFVELPEEKFGFLPDKDNISDCQEGGYLAVQVVRSAQNEKGPRLSAKVTLNGELPLPKVQKPTLLQRGPSPLLELALRHPDAPVFIKQRLYMSHVETALHNRITVEPRAFDSFPEDDILQLSEFSVALSNGVEASFAPTPALVAIDLDLKQNLSDTRPKQVTQFALNLTAVEEVTRQIQLRNFSGAIMIDPAGLSVKKRLTLCKHLPPLLNRDPLKPKFMGATALGFFEILRPRRRPPLHELASNPYGQAISMLRRISSAMRKHNAARPLYIGVGSDIADVFKNDPILLDIFMQTTGIMLNVESDPALSPERWCYIT